jgi:hypothetical protein
MEEQNHNLKTVNTSFEINNVQVFGKVATNDNYFHETV